MHLIIVKKLKIFRTATSIFIFFCGWPIFQQQVANENLLSNEENHYLDYRKLSLLINEFPADPACNNSNYSLTIFRNYWLERIGYLKYQREKS